MKLILVLPVLPTYARTLSRDETVMAAVYPSTIIIVVMIANRSSPISAPDFCCTGVCGRRGAALTGESLAVVLDGFQPFGRHFKTASTEALQGWT